MASDGIKIPRGWERVTKGKAKKGDRGYSSASEMFEPADLSLIFASRFTCLIRRKPAPAKKAAKVFEEISPAHTAAGRCLLRTRPKKAAGKWEERESLAELEPENARLQEENDLLRALLWAAGNAFFANWYFSIVRMSLFENGTNDHHIGRSCDLSLIPAPVAARLVADWREAMGK